MNQEILKITDVIKSTVAAERIYLFGSHAYGVPDKESDYDFFIVIPDDGAAPLDVIRRTRVSLIPLNRDFSVDILADYQSRFEQRAKLNTLERKIANEGLVLYERAEKT